MASDFDNLFDRARRSLISRRGFLRGVTASGVVAAFAEPLLSDAAKAAQPRQGGTLTMGLGGGQSTNSLDPALNSSQVPFVYFSTMGNLLVAISPDSKATPCLAESWDSSDDLRVWTFKIRKGVEFHNGKTMTPEDVLKTLQRHSDKESKSGAYGIMQGISHMKVDGDDLIVTLAEPDADLPYLMSDYHLVIQPNGGLDKPDAGIFTGPYKLKSFEPGVRVVMEKFKNYWNSGEGHFDRVEILVINDSVARNAALQSDQVQMINEVEPRMAHLLKRSAKIEVPATSGRGYYCFNMLCDATPFDNADLRMALKLAIDRQEIVDKILTGYGTIGNDIPVNAAYPLFDDSIPQRTYDPDKAAFHYRKSGHSGPIVLRTADTAFPGAVNASELFQQSAKKAGIPIQIKRVPDDGYWSEVWIKKPFSGCHWAGRPTQGQMYSTVYLSSAHWNDTHFDDPAFDKLIIEARSVRDPAKRKELYSAAGKRLRDTGGLINPMFSQFIAAYRNDRVTGWEDNPNQVMMNGLAAVKCWAA